LINQRYRELLDGFPGISFQEEQEGSYSNYWLSTILIDPVTTGISNDRLRVVFLKNDIETRFLWKPLHLQPVFKDMPYYGGNVSERLFKTGLCLPSSVTLTLDDQKQVVSHIEKELIKTLG
jgi:dTDP-4-amino-4,6-dideoxygalactose transaminase